MKTRGLNQCGEGIWVSQREIRIADEVSMQRKADVKSGYPGGTN